MGKSVEKTVDLLRKSYAGKLEESEQREVDRLLSDERMRQLYECIGDDEYLIREFRRYDAYLPDRGYQAFCRKIRRQKMSRVWRRLSVAAVVLFAVGCGWLLMNRMGTTEPVVVATSTVEHGNYRAYLQLSSGKRILLEDAEQGELHEAEGSVRVDSGKVLYATDKVSQSLNTDAYHILSVPPGGEYRLLLADGTAIHLNAETELRYPVAFTASERRVFLKGEAWFEVAKDAEKPFVVETELGYVRVFGTEFNIRNYAIDHEIKTTLVEGSVGFLRKGDRAEQYTKIEPGYQIRCAEEAGSRPEIRKVKVADEIAWKNGAFCFVRCSLERIMQDIGRWYDVDIVFTEDALRQMRFTVTLHRYQDIGKLLRYFEEAAKLQFHIQGKNITISRK
ncbi:MAG: DUF4974 domain-containing protein [Odoribacter sp.]|nr:DUF4974 domain-containing protein [Odoribacter sp.]